MNKFASILVGGGLAALQGCSWVEPADSTASQTAEINAGSATLTYTSSTDTNYCATVTLTNGFTTQSTNLWVVILDLKTSTKTSVTGATFSANTGKVSVKPTSTTMIPAGSSTSFSFCANAPSTVRPTIAAWNMQLPAVTSCVSNNGLHPTKAALAIAVAKEIGRWQPLTDFVRPAGYGPSAKVTLNASAPCTDGCANVKGLLGLQDTTLVNVVNQNTFDPMNYIGDLQNSFDRHSSLITDLTRNNRSMLPPAHKLTLIGGPTDIGVGSCGPHYIFQADKPDGTPLTTAQAQALGNALCFFGYGGCGGNQYIAFTTTTVSCPAGRTCVAIDPTDGDNGSTNTTSAGDAPTYPQNRAWDPENTLLNSLCIKVNGNPGTMVSKCDTNPNSCGFLYCT